MRVEERYQLLKSGELHRQIEDQRDFLRLNELNKKSVMVDLTLGEEVERADLEDRLKGKDLSYLKGLNKEELVRIEANLPKVENVLRIKQELVAQIREIREEVLRIEMLEQAEKQRVELETKRENIDKQWHDLDSQIAKTKENTPERAKLIQEQERLKKEFANNEKASLENQKVFAHNKEGGKSKLSGKNKEELARMSFDLGAKVSKCNEAARELMNGRDIGDIQLDRNVSNRTFNAQNELKRLISSGKKEQKENEELIESVVPNNGLLPTKSTFLERHPRLLGIVNRVKNFWKKIKNDREQPENNSFTDRYKKANELLEKNKDKSLETILEEKEKQNAELEKKLKDMEQKIIRQLDEQVGEKDASKKTVYIPKDEKGFEEFLKDAAERGADEASKKARTNSEAYARLQENKFKATIRQDAKLGENYSERSRDDVIREYRREQTEQQDNVR